MKSDSCRYALLRFCKKPVQHARSCMAMSSTRPALWHAAKALARARLAGYSGLSNPIAA